MSSVCFTFKCRQKRLKWYFVKVNATLHSNCILEEMLHFEKMYFDFFFFFFAMTDVFIVDIAVFVSQLDLSVQEKEQYINVTRWFDHIQHRPSIRHHLPPVAVLRNRVYPGRLHWNQTSPRWTDTHKSIILFHCTHLSSTISICLCSCFFPQFVPGLARHCPLIHPHPQVWRTQLQKLFHKMTIDFGAISHLRECLWIKILVGLCSFFFLNTCFY